MVPPWGKGSNSRGRTHGRNALSDDVVAAGADMVAAVVADTAAMEVVAGGAATAAAEPGLESLVGRGEDCLTLGRKLCPPHVFTMAGLEKERRRRGWEEKRFQK